MPLSRRQMADAIANELAEDLGRLADSLLAFRERHDRYFLQLAVHSSKAARRRLAAAFDGFDHRTAPIGDLPP